MENPGSVHRSIKTETATAELSTGATLFIWSIRQWLVSARERQCIKRALMIPYHRLDCVSAIYPLDALMCVMTDGARRRIQIRCPHQSRLSDDERQLLLLLQASQRRDPATARREAGNLVHLSQTANLQEAAEAYARVLAHSGLSLSAPPKLTLLDGALS